MYCEKDPQRVFCEVIRYVVALSSELCLGIVIAPDRKGYSQSLVIVGTGARIPIHAKLDVAVALMVLRATATVCMKPNHTPCS